MCTYNITRSRFHKTIVAVEKQCLTCLCVCECAHVRSCVCGGLGTRALPCACARVALLIQHATRRYIAICGLSGFTVFFDIFS